MIEDAALRVAGWLFWFGISALATLSFVFDSQLRDSWWIGISVFGAAALYFLSIAIWIVLQIGPGREDSCVRRAKLFFHPGALVTMPYLMVLIWLADEK